MRTFVDVGSHEGQTLEEVLHPVHMFDRVFAIEPMPAQLEVLRARFGSDPRVRIIPNAMWFRTGALTMYGTNEALEASPYAVKVDVDDHVQTVVWGMRASEFFDRFLMDEPGDVYVNMNCEGAEVPILCDLVVTGRIFRITSLLVDFDCRKVPGMEADEQRVRALFADIGFDRYTNDYGEGSHQEQIARWLERSGALAG